MIFVIQNVLNKRNFWNKIMKKIPGKNAKILANLDIMFLRSTRAVVRIKRKIKNKHH